MTDNNTSSLPARIDLEGLERDLNSFKTKLEGWADGIVTQTENEKLQHVREMQKLTVAIQELQKEEEELSQQALRVRQRLAEEGSEEESLAREVEELRSRQRLLPDRIAEVQQALDVEANKYIRRKAKLDSKEGVQKDVERGLKKIIDAYSKHLGLILSPRNDGIEIAFSQIDRNDPNRTFFIRVYCDDDNVYSVTACSPMIDVQSYLEDLNATGDFSSFVMNVRKSFVASVQPHSQFS